MKFQIFLFAPHSELRLDWIEKKANEMRFNKQELATLATQPSNKFEKEGILYITERQDGFFRRAESKNLPHFLQFIIRFFHVHKYNICVHENQ